MLQDQCKELSRWLATRPGARRLVDMRVIEIVKERLTADGFGGLVAPGGECGCELADLAPCNSDFSQCAPGYKHMDPRKDESEGWAIWKQKEPPTDEQWATVSY